MTEIYNKTILKHRRRRLRQGASVSEKGLWQYLRKRQMGGFRFLRQYSVGWCVVDFYCPAANLVVELDGPQHRDPAHQISDQRRDAYIQSLGLFVYRIPVEDLDDRFEETLKRLEEMVVRCAKKEPTLPSLSKREGFKKSCFEA